MELKLKYAEKKEFCQQNKQGEVEYLTFPLLRDCGFVKHLFSTRIGGVSEGIFSSMNLSYTRGDNKESVDENYDRIAGILGCSREDMVLSHQTHTTNVRVVTKEDRGKGITRERDYEDVDGLITNVPGIMLVTFYADCVPLYFVDTKNHAIGLSHSGWKGTVNRMGAATLSKMKEAFGTSSSDVLAVIGPSICQSCYEVSRDVIMEFEAAFPKISVQKKLCYEKENGKYQLNLWEANKQILREAGVPDTSISIAGVCTCCNSDILFSHRASHGKRGNLAAFLGLMS